MASSQRGEIIEAQTSNVAKFTNIYHADDVNVALRATKILNVVVGNRTH